jgi:L-ascorbate metabolism protein UlaG (beta-lactamase superfamily)
MMIRKRRLFFLAAAAVALLISAFLMGSVVSADKQQHPSNHFDGLRYFNPDVPQTSPSTPETTPRRSASWWVWNWIFNNDWPEWPVRDIPFGPRPVARVPKGEIRVTTVGHATFLIQMDGLNILIDPIWSDRCGPAPWIGIKRRLRPGIRFEDLPAIDVVLVSHNHYDHLDLPTLALLAKKGTPRAVAPLGNLALLQGAGIPIVDELDWWQKVRASPDVTITLVPAQHFSMRTLWDRNKTLWGGFVISGFSGNVFYSGDTGYGPHFQEIARRFSPFRLALLPIAPFRPQKTNGLTPWRRSIVHMGPEEAVLAYMDLGAPFTLAAHFQTFRLGVEGFDDAGRVLAATLKEHHQNPDTFVVPVLGQAVIPPPLPEALSSPVSEEYGPKIFYDGFPVNMKKKREFFTEGQAQGQ